MVSPLLCEEMYFPVPTAAGKSIFERREVGGKKPEIRGQKSASSSVF